AAPALRPSGEYVGSAGSMALDLRGRGPRRAILDQYAARRGTPADQRRIQLDVAADRTLNQSRSSIDSDLASTPTATSPTRAGRFCRAPSLRRESAFRTPLLHSRGATVTRAPYNSPVARDRSRSIRSRRSTEAPMTRTHVLSGTFVTGMLTVTAVVAGVRQLTARDHDGPNTGSQVIFLRAPAGTRPAMRHTTIDGLDGAVLPNGRLLTPAGIEVGVDAPKPFGLALSPNGQVVATINSGASRFSITLIRQWTSPTPNVTRIAVNATFMGIVFSADGSRFFASGGENGNIWIGDTNANKIVGSINLNGIAHPLLAPLDVTTNPPGRFKGAYPGNMTLDRTGRFLFVVDQGSFDVFVIDTNALT